MSRTPVIKTRKRRIFLIHPLGTLPTILASLQQKNDESDMEAVRTRGGSDDCFSSFVSGFTTLYHGLGDGRRLL